MNKRIPILLGMFLVALAVSISLFPSHQVGQFIERIEHLGYDLQLRAHLLTKRHVMSSPVAIIDIDDKSLKAIGRWPWPRSKVAELVDALQKQEAAIIAFDVSFSEKEENIIQRILDRLKKTNVLTSSMTAHLEKNKLFFDEDSVLAKRLAKTHSILALSFLPRDQTHNILPAPLLTLSSQEKKELHFIRPRGYISNIPILQHAAMGSGFINIYPDSDGIIRRVPLLIEYQGGIYPSLSLQAVLSFLGEKIKLITPYYGDHITLEGIQIGETMIPTDARGQVFIPYVGKSYTFPYYSAIDVLEGRLPQDALSGKILFVGTSATGLGDLHATAVHNPFPGVEIQATLATGLLQGHFSYQPAWVFGANLVLAIFFGILAAVAFPYFGPRTLGLLIILFPMALFSVNNLIWQKTGLLLFLFLPALLVASISFLNIIYGYMFETRRREHLKEMFGQYVPTKHIDEMLKETGSYGMQGESREMTVLFADIRNFTTVSEGMSAALLVELLNAFFTPMTEIIFKHSGTIDKYVGDMIMAFWGAPLKDKRHERHALQSALEMQTKIKELHPFFIEHKWPDIKIGIGINSGMMNVGDMGSRFRRNYTVLGDTVNLASRIEGLTKFYGVDIIAGESTIKDQKNFIFRKLDCVKVKGKRESGVIYEVVCAREKLSPLLTQELELYHQALDYYFKQQWEEAYERMHTLHQAHHAKKLYKLYLDRIEEFKKNPLPADWDGVYVHTAK